MVDKKEKISRPLILRPGDIFLSRNPMMLGRLINWVQAFTSKDNQSEYSHAGVIIDYKATTFEALWTNRCQNFFEAYKDKQVLIARHQDMDSKRAIDGWNGVKHHEGKIYAGHRLLFFLLCPPLAKYFSLGMAVCSELTMKFLCKAGLSTCWRGFNPDDVHDMVTNWKKYAVIYEGILPQDSGDFGRQQHDDPYIDNYRKVEMTDVKPAV